MSRPDATPATEDVTMPPLVYETVAWLRFYTHLPLPNLPGETEAATAADPLRTAQAVPIAGALIGAFAGLVLAILSSLGASSFVAAAAATLTLVAATHARPELAVAALAERMLGGPNGAHEHHGTLAGLAERFRLHGHADVLLAARISIYGVLSILVAVLIRVGALESLTAKAAVATAFALIGAGAVSRAAATSFALIRPGSTEGSPLQGDQSALQWLVAIGLGIGIVTVLPGFGVGATIAGIAAAIGAAALITAFVPRAETEGGRLFAGTAELIAEIAFLMAVVAFARTP
jgi:adenosylcobinamide-GDP ribazoletransferase